MVKSKSMEVMKAVQEDLGEVKTLIIIYHVVMLSFSTAGENYLVYLCSPGEGGWGCNQKLHTGFI